MPALSGVGEGQLFPNCCIACNKYIEAKELVQTTDLRQIWIQHA